MLYVPWKNETEIQGKFGSYEEAFFAKHDEVKDKIAVYEPMSSVLELVEEDLEQEDRENNPVIAPSTQYENDMQGNADPNASHELAFYEPDHTSTLYQVDIGPFLGIRPVHIEPDDVNLIPNIMTDEKYYYMVEEEQANQLSLVQFTKDFIGC